jgi:hypothetical protein
MEDVRAFGYVYHWDLAPYWDRDVELQAIHTVKLCIIRLCEPRSEVMRQYFCAFFQQLKRKIIIVGVKSRSKMSAKRIDDFYLGCDGITTD